MTPRDGRAVSVQENVVIKVQQPEASRRERLRTLAGQDVAQQTGLFVVPRIVSFDDSSGEIVFERLELMEMRRALSSLDRSLELVERAAGALAAIHRYLKPYRHAVSINAGEVGPSPAGDRVSIHGDFGMRNVFYIPGSDGLAIIDWSNAHWMGVDADIAEPEIDVAVFILSLFHRRPFGPWRVAHRHKVARHFLATYAAASPHGLSLTTLRQVVAASIPRFNRQVYRSKGILRALAYRYSMIDLKFFLSRLSHTG
jgi:hypothetical protein